MEVGVSLWRGTDSTCVWCGTDGHRSNRTTNGREEVTDKSGERKAEKGESGSGQKGRKSSKGGGNCKRRKTERLESNGKVWRDKSRKRR